MYISVADAETYFDGKLNTAAWDVAVSADKTKALTQATTIINQLRFNGDKADDAQTDEFPRGDDTTVPLNIQYACAEIALALLDGVDPEKEYASLGNKTETYSTMRRERRDEIPEHIIAGVPSITAWRFLKPYLRPVTDVILNRMS